jgi:hypothetical protein
VNRMFQGDDARHVEVLEAVFNSFSHEEKILLCSGIRGFSLGIGVTKYSADSLEERELILCKLEGVSSIEAAFSKTMVQACPADLLDIELEELPAIICEPLKTHTIYGDEQKILTKRAIQRRYYEKRLEIGV